MGTRVRCKSCRRLKSPLATECRDCGHNPYKHIKPILGRIRLVPAARGEVRILHKAWRRLYPKKQRICGVVLKDIHAFCHHALVLRELGKRSDRSDRRYHYDDIWFFLRGGYPYWAHLNLNSRMKLRSAVFMGITRPLPQLQGFIDYTKRLITRSFRLRISRIDIAVVDEVESGTGMNTLARRLRRNILPLLATAHAGRSLDIVIHRFMIKRPIGHTLGTLQANLRGGTSVHGGIRLTFTDDIIVGPIFAYDDAELLGVERTRSGYSPVLYSANGIEMQCPTNKLTVYSSVPGDNDIPTYLSNFASEMASRKRFQNNLFLRSGLLTQGCAICRQLRRYI